MASLTTASTASNAVSREDGLLLCLGVIADVQYADCDDAYDFGGKRRRYYRASLEKLRSAVEAWKSHGAQCSVQVGDLIDGRCARLGKSHACLQQTLDVLREAPSPLFHLIGNHELYNFPREELCSPNGSWYGIDEQRKHGIFYHKKVVHGVMLIFLDAYAVSIMNGETAASTAEARSLLASKNPNSQQIGVDWTAGLSKENLKYLPYNGKFGETQLDWLRRELESIDAQDSGLPAIVFSHVSFCPGSCAPSCQTWDNVEALQIVQASKSVMCCVYGHAHRGGYHQDECGIHHITLASPLEARQPTHGVLQVYKDHAELLGWGNVPSRSMIFRDANSSKI